MLVPAATTPKLHFTKSQFFLQRLVGLIKVWVNKTLTWIFPQYGPFIQFLSNAGFRSCTKKNNNIPYNTFWGTSFQSYCCQLMKVWVYETLDFNLVRSSITRFFLLSCFFMQMAGIRFICTHTEITLFILLYIPFRHFIGSFSQ